MAESISAASAWTTQLRRIVATVASRWRHCADLTGPGIEPQTSRIGSVRLATEPTDRSRHIQVAKQCVRQAYAMHAAQLISQRAEGGK